MPEATTPPPSSQPPAATGPVATTIEATPEQLASVRYDDDGLVVAIVQDDVTNAVLMQAYMNAETLAMSLAQGRTVFWSRSRQEIWRKGDTSGEHQYIRSAHFDCDGDALLFRVEQLGGGACHTGQYSCFHNPFGAADDTNTHLQDHA